MTGKVVLTATLLSVLLVALGCAPRVPALDAAECKEVTYDSGGAPVRAMLCHPAGEQADLPAVIYLHGSGAEYVPPGFPVSLEEMMPVGVYRDLAEEGFVSLGIFYFSQLPEAGENPDTYDATFREDLLELRPSWRRIIKDGLAFLKSQPEVADDRIGLVGWSLGGSLALPCAAEVAEYKAVVVLSGYISDADNPDAIADGLPPVLILHGESDDMVPVEYAYRIRDVLEEAGVPYELVVIPGGDHLWRDEQGEEGFERMIQFLKDNLH
jgi:dipeptidyl aminopeptidase/acylaminoacyl peptidase